MAKRKKNLGGRPPKAPGDKYVTPVRVLGRVSDERWQSYQEAARTEEKTFTEWACGELDKAVKRQKRKS